MHRLRTTKQVDLKLKKGNQKATNAGIGRKKRKVGFHPASSAHFGYVV